MQKLTDFESGLPKSYTLAGTFWTPCGWQSGFVSVSGSQVVQFLNRQNKEVVKPIIDCSEFYIYPGFCDAHIHLRELCVRQQITTVGKNGSLISLEQDIFEQLSHQPGKKLYIFIVHPTIDLYAALSVLAKGLLSKTESPIVLLSPDGHHCLVNQTAWQKIPTDLLTDFHLGQSEQHVGSWVLVKEESVWRIQDFLFQRFGQANIEKMLRCALIEMRKAGITCVNAIDTGYFAQTVNKLKYRLPNMFIFWIVDVRNDRVFPTPELENIIGAKQYIDGTFYGRSADLTFECELSQKKLTIPLSSIKQHILLCNSLSIWACFHTIGDGAVRKVLDATEELAKELNIQPKIRVEHVQVIKEEDISRCAQMKFVCSMQPSHLVNDFELITSMLTMEAYKTAYAWNALYKSGVDIIFGSDAPFSDYSVEFGLYAAVSFRNEKNWHTHNSLDASVAIQAYTNSIWHICGFNVSKQLGTFVPGGPAAFTLASSPIEQSIHEPKGKSVVGSIVEDELILA